jgi:hypothetical protein
VCNEREVLRLLNRGRRHEIHNFFPGLDDYNTGAESYPQMVEEAKRQLSVPV